ncbi:MAG TPA: TetR/AcrR family transcriptional regulator [Nocardioidaceae bacterium]|nr:TetR/AcrR family transcriptional regulator [Nocardioidaceae bacterium]
MPTATRPRAAHLGPERRRPEVLDAALAIALRDGVGAVTFVAVAEELGVTRPVVYAVFRDRVELIEALIAREREHLQTSVLAALHSATDPDPETAFVGGFQALLRTVAEQPVAWRLLMNGVPDPAVTDHFRDARATVTRSATEWIGPAMEHWWHTPDLDRKLPVLIELFMSSAESAVRSLLDHSDTWTPEALGEFVGRAVHRAFKDA